MRFFLKILGLIEKLKIELDIEKTEYIKSLRSKVVRNQSESFCFFQSKEKIYEGYVLQDSFEIRINGNPAIAFGTFEEGEKFLIVNIEIRAFNNYGTLFGILVVTFQVFLVSFIFLFSKWEEHLGIFTIPFILINALIWLVLPYFSLRRSMKRLAFEIKKDFIV